MKKIIIALMVSSLLFVATGCGCSKEPKEKEPTEEENQPIGNTNEGITKDQQVGDLTMTNTTLITQDSTSVFTTTVTNSTERDVVVDIVDIFIKDADGNEIATLHGYVGGVVPAQSSREIISNCTIDLSNAAFVEYQLN